jgi:hypothetical protein
MAITVLAVAASLADAQTPAPETRKGSEVSTFHTAFYTFGPSGKLLGSISASVTNDAGAYLPGVTVTVIEPLQGIVLGSGKTDSGGVLTLPDLGGKTVFVIAAQNGFRASGIGGSVSRDCEARVALQLRRAPKRP